MELNQLIHHEQNLAACYEAEYLLSLKVNDQRFCDFSYDDPSEISMTSGLPQQSPCSGVTNTYNSVQNTSECDNYTNVAEMHESQSPTNEDGLQLANSQPAVCDMASQYACSADIHSQFNPPVNHTMHLQTRVGSIKECHGAFETSEQVMEDMDSDVDTEKLHMDGPSRKRTCLRQSES